MRTNISCEKLNKIKYKIRFTKYKNEFCTLKRIILHIFFTLCHITLFISFTGVFIEYRLFLNALVLPTWFFLCHIL